MVKVLRYNQTKLNILHEIARLQLKVGDMLPGERTLAARMSISMGTLRRALAELEEQSVIRKEQGRGNILRKSIPCGGMSTQIALIHIKRFITDGLPNLGILEEYLHERDIALQYVPMMSFDRTLIAKVEKCFAVLVTGWLDREWIQSLQLLNKPMVAIGSHQYSNLLPWVSYDWKGAAELLTRQLIIRKAKRIGLLNGSHRYYPSTLIYEGYKKVIAAAGLELNENRVSWITREEVYEKTKDFILHQLPHLDAVLFEPGSFTPFLSLCWSMGIPPDKPLAVASPYNHYYGSACLGNNIVQTVFDKDIYIVGAEMFLKALQRDDEFRGEFLVNARLAEEMRPFPEKEQDGGNLREESPRESMVSGNGKKLNRA